MTNLIEGVNPLVISKIKWSKAYRYGKHPLWYKFSRRKHPILWRFGFIEENYFEWHRAARVTIHGSDGEPVNFLSCTSNAKAKKLCDELNKDLDKFLSSVRMELR
jgi:hypothetical protein